MRPNLRFVRGTTAALALALTASVSMAGIPFFTPTVDGVLDSHYDAAVNVQTCDTGFGNVTTGVLGPGGSELDALYVARDSTHLYLMLTGNLESNGNTINIFIDNVASTGGVSVAPAIAGGDGLFGAGRLGGTTFPTGMNVDYGLSFKHFNNGSIGTGESLEYRMLAVQYPSTFLFDSNASGSPVQDQTFNASSGEVTGQATMDGTSQGAGTYSFALNMSNIAGVNGSGGPAYGNTGDPAAVTTGFEISIPLADIPGTLNYSSSIKIFAAVSNPNADYWANQFLPGLTTPAGNLGFADDLSALLVPATISLAPAPPEPPLVYVGSILANGNPLPLAGDANGGLYYATFNSSVAPSSEVVVYVADPIAEVGNVDLTNHQVVGSATFEAGRGWQGLAVDSSGEVYASGDNNPNAVLTNVLKWGPAPTFTANASWNAFAATAAAGRRWGGLALATDSNGYAVGVAFATFNSINWVNAVIGNSAGYTNVGGGTNYQREPLFNARDNIIYPLRNGNSTDDMIVGYYSGGTPSAGNYPWTASVLISDGAVNSAFGSSTQHGYIDNSANPPRVYTVDTFASPQPGPARVRLWDVGTGGTSLTQVYEFTGTLGGAGWTSANDCVVVGSRLYVSDTNSGLIYVYETPTVTAAENFEMYR